MIRNLVEDSYDLVVVKLSRSQQQDLSWGGLS
jgi:predicted DNA-binding protein (MmcQ/YjbR family)